MLALLAGCGGGDDAGSPDEAIKTLFDKTVESMQKGEPTIDPTLFAGTPTEEDLENPIAAPGDSSRTLVLGEAPADGTAGMEVTVANTFTTNAEGTGTLTSTVVEKGTGYEFLHYTATIHKPQLSYRVPSWGLSSLAEDGTGSAFFFIALESSGTVSRTFSNVNTANGHALIAFGDETVPSGTATGTGGGKFEFPIAARLVRENGTLVARIDKAAQPIYAKITFKRDDATGAPPDLTLSSFTAGGTALGGTDPVFAVGADVPGLTGVAAGAAVSLHYAVSGTGEDQFVGAEVAGPFAMETTEIEGAAGDFTSPLVTEGEAGVGDGKVQLAGVYVSVFVAGTVPELEHSIKEEDMAAQDLVSAAYLAPITVLARGAIILY